MKEQYTLSLTPDTYLLQDLKKATRADNTIDWNCECIKPYLQGPCVNEFKNAYECYIKNGLNKELCQNEINMYRYCNLNIRDVSWIFKKWKKIRNGLFF